MTFPIHIAKYLYPVLLSDGIFSYLRLDEQGHLIEWGGPIYLYGFPNLTKGQLIFEQVNFLEGLLPVSHTQVLQFVRLEQGHCVHIHLVPIHQDTWVLLFDATHEHNQKQKEQQQANNLALLIYHQHQLLRKLEATYQVAKKEQVKSDQIYFGATKTVKEQHTPQVVQSSVDTSLLVVNNLFDYVKSNLGEITLYFNRCDMRHILANLKTLFTPSALQKETVFSVKTIDPMPKWLICDELYFQQALINLITQMMTLFVYSTVQLTLSWRENRLEFVLAGRSESSFAAPTPSSISTNVVYNTNLMLSRHLIERMGGGLTVESTSEHQTIYRGFIIASNVD